MSRAAHIREVWTSQQALTVWVEPVAPSFPPPENGVVEAYLPKSRAPAGEDPRLADLVLEMLEVVDAVAAYKLAECDGAARRCTWEDHDARCPKEVTRRRVLDAHTAFETRVTEEQTS